MSASQPQPVLYGLVLAGGHSSRMQRDKAALSYHGRSQLEWAVSLLEAHVSRTFVSVRADQAADPIRASFPQIVDEHPGLGPIAGIVAAQSRHPHVAWLVVACDLPFLDSATLTHLISQRRPGRQATAYRSSRDGLPEPLCAIFEPSSGEALREYVGGGKSCPRKFLLRADTELLDAISSTALDNINTPQEYGEAMAAIDSKTVSSEAHAATSAHQDRKQINVQYYALLREQAGRSAETLTTAARTPRELYQELRARYPFSLAPEMLRVAVNAEFGEWTRPLVDGDSIVFIPPVAGG